MALSILVQCHGLDSRKGVMYGFGVVSTNVKLNQAQPG